MSVRRRLCLLVQRKERQERLEQRVVTDFRSVIFALNLFTKVQAGISRRTEAREKSQKQKAMNILILKTDFQPLKHPMKKDMVIPGNRMIGLPAGGLTILGPQLLDGLARRLTLHGWRQTL